MKTKAATEPSMKNLDDVMSSPSKNATNLPQHQGYLLKKKKYMGFKNLYVVLNKGCLIYYHDEDDAKNDRSRRGTYSLNNCTVEEYQNSPASHFLAFSWTVNFPSGHEHTLCALSSTSAKMMGIKTPVKTAKVCNKLKPNSSGSLNPTDRKTRWVSAFKQHIEFMMSDLDIPVSPKEIQRQMSMIPAERIQQQIDILTMDRERVQATLRNIDGQLKSGSRQDLNKLGIESTIRSSSKIKPEFEMLKVQFEVLVEDMNKLVSLHEQKIAILESQLVNSHEKNKVLEESLKALSSANGESKSRQSPLSSVGEEIVVTTHSSTNSTPSDISDYEEYYDTAEENEHQAGHRRSEKKGGSFGYQGFQEFKRSERLQSLPEDDKENCRDSGICNEVVKASPLTPEIDLNSWRIRLPAPMIDRSKISLWTIAKHFIGKDLTKISMPVFVCEPMSFLQRIAENAQYSLMLNQVCDTSDPCKRMELMAAYSITICSSIERISKPFNPILGETYEMVREDLGFRIVCEQVSHHPPISAFHTESTDPRRPWTSFGSVNPKIKFWGKSVEVEPKGFASVDFPDLNETYVWCPAKTTIHNAVVGTPWFEYSGKLEVLCVQTGYKAIIDLKPYSRSNKDWHKFDGYVYDCNENKLKALYGSWSHCVYSCDPVAYEQHLKTNKPLPMAKFDKFFNIVDPLIPLNTHTSNYNLQQASLSPVSGSVRLNSSHSVPRFVLSGSESVDDLFESDTIGKHSLARYDLAAKKDENFSSISSLSNLIKDLTELWTVNPHPPYSAETYYNLSYFAMSLNELKKGMEKVLPPTDSRFRTDIRRLEFGDLDGASREKNRLEEKQREARKNQTDEYKPMWFYPSKHPQMDHEEWIFNNKYWQRDYVQSPDLF